MEQERTIYSSENWMLKDLLEDYVTNTENINWLTPHPPFSNNIGTNMST